MEGRRETTYLASYHGLAARGGSQVVANCASCHGVHNILPSSDPRSTINHANLARTCGQCHPGVTEKFTAARVHVDAPLSADVGSKAGALDSPLLSGHDLRGDRWHAAHNFIIWRSKVIARRKLQHSFVMRMPLRFRLQHGTLLISFIVLVLTGFALKFPDSWFASALSLGEHRRQLVHRIAAVVLIGVSVYHILDITFSREGRKLDVRSIPQSRRYPGRVAEFCYYLGFTNEARFARFNYAEKAEYWALVWGHDCDGCNRNHVVGQGYGRESSAALVAGYCDGHSFL